MHARPPRRPQSRLDAFIERRAVLRETYGDGTHRVALDEIRETAARTKHRIDPLTQAPLLTAALDDEVVTFTAFTGQRWQLRLSPVLLLHRELVDGRLELIRSWDVAITNDRTVLLVRANERGDGPGMASDAHCAWAELLDDLVAEALASLDCGVNA